MHLCENESLLKMFLFIKMLRIESCTNAENFTKIGGHFFIIGIYEDL